MASSILTPATLWEKFNIDVTPEAELIDEREEGGLSISRIYIDGPLTKAGRVKIFATLTVKTGATKMPAVVFIDGLKMDIDKDAVVQKRLANEGYMVLSIDVAGKWGEKEFFTIYPEDVSYANYESARGHLSEVKTTADKTCWYEWGRVLRYAMNYLKNQESVTRIGIVGVKSGSTLVWHASATEPYISCAVSVMGAGWSIYKGISKFSDDIEPQFSDEVLKYVAGIEAQSYAKNVLCPMLTLVATNNASYDCDRAYDTIARIDNEIYKALDYSANYVTGVESSALKNISLFLDKHLKIDQTITLPFEPQVKCELNGGKIFITATVDAKNLKETCCYVAEGEYHPYKRAWKKIYPHLKKSLGKKSEEYYYEFLPLNDSGIVCFFTKAEYENGFTISSNISAKRFKESEVLPSHKSGILYSGREELSKTIFCPKEFALEREESPISVDKKLEVIEKSGPMGIAGITADKGLFTFKINSSGITLSDDSILMLDVYSKEEGLLTVKLYEDFLGEKTEYLLTVKLYGGRVWQNVKFELSKFKTAEGRPLKNIEKIEAMEISAQGKFLVNNALWI